MEIANVAKIHLAKFVQILSNNVSKDDNNCHVKHEPTQKFVDTLPPARSRWDHGLKWRLARLFQSVSVARSLLHFARKRCYYSGSNQSWLSLVRPLNSPKNASCIFRVRGPQPPLPMEIWSSWRTGVTSAAVPVMNISSAT